MKVTFKIAKGYMPETSSNYERTYYIIMKKGWFSWKVLIEDIGIFGVTSRYSYFSKCYKLFYTKDEAQLYLLTLEGIRRLKILK